jgi:hypothetical protein
LFAVKIMLIQQRMRKGEKAFEKKLDKRIKKR